MKTDTGGNLVWAKTYGNSSNEEAGYQIRNSIDGNFLSVDILKALQTDMINCFLS